MKDREGLEDHHMEPILGCMSKMMTYLDALGMTYVLRTWLST